MRMGENTCEKMVKCVKELPSIRTLGLSYFFFAFLLSKARKISYFYTCDRVCMFTAIMAAVVCFCVSGRSFFVFLCLYSMFIKFDTSFHITLCKRWYVLKAWNKIIMINTVVQNKTYGRTK